MNIVTSERPLQTKIYGQQGSSLPSGKNLCKQVRITVSALWQWTMIIRKAAWIYHRIGNSKVENLYSAFNRHSPLSDETF